MDDTTFDPDAAGTPAAGPSPVPARGAGSPEPEPAGRAAEPEAPASTAPPGSGEELAAEGERSAARRRRRGSRGGRNRRRTGAGDTAAESDDDGPGDVEAAPTTAAPRAERSRGRATKTPRPSAEPGELPEPMREGRVLSPDAAARALVKKPRIGDSRPAPPAGASRSGLDDAGRGDAGGPLDGPLDDAMDDTIDLTANGEVVELATPGDSSTDGRRRRRRGGRGTPATAATPVTAEVLERRRGRERKGRPVGRYLMCVHVRPEMVQIAILEGRSLIEHYVSRPSDDVGQIHGNVYVGRVQNVLPGMEAAFIDIGTPKNAVLYRGDVQYDQEDLLDSGVAKGERPRIEQVLKPRQLIVCQVTKNPIGAKGARLTQEVSMPGRFVVLVPNSKTYGISKRLPDEERKRLRAILDRVKPAEHGIIVRTAAESVSEDELQADVVRLVAQWQQIEARARKANGPTLLYREPGIAVRVIREEFNADYRGVLIDDPALFAEVKDYVTSFNPELADRVELYDAEAEGLPVFERHHVHEQLHKALDRKVWLPSGGSLIIEHTEALTVIDVNTGKNVGSSNLEDTVLHNNVEAAKEIARQLRLRDIGGIIVIDFIDMEIRENRATVIQAFRDALARDKTRTQVFEISELGLVEMTRKRIGEGLLTAFARSCPDCEGRGMVVDHTLID